MKNKTICLFLLLFTYYLFSQENIDTPFVSKLNFELSNSKIQLSWENPNDFNDFITIYRSNKLIDSVNKLSKSEKIVTLKNNENKYIDTPKEYGNYYYAVVTTDKATNKDNAILIPYRNYTLKPASIIKSDFFQITAIKADSKNTYNKIEWNYKTNSDEAVKVNIFRNTHAITDNEKLKSSIKIATIDIASKQYIDVPVSNIDYYYAVFIEGEDNKDFKTNTNITNSPVSVNVKEEIFPEFSSDTFTPLPLIAIENDPTSGKYFLDPQILRNPKKVNYNEITKKIINDDRSKYIETYNKYVKEKQENLQKLPFHVLNDEDIYEPQEYKIEYKTAIIQIKMGEYDKALLLLEEVIKEILPDDLTKRVSYYIGLIYYTKENYYQSYVYLVTAYSSYRREVIPYFKSIYLNIFEKLER